MTENLTAFRCVIDPVAVAVGVVLEGTADLLFGMWARSIFIASHAPQDLIKCHFFITAMIPFYK